MTRGKVEPEVIRFWGKVDQSGGAEACWLWLGGQNSNGYGIFWAGDRKEVAHRTAWRLSGRALDRSLTLDHRCRVRLCVNPFHIDQVSMRENVLRGVGRPARHAVQTHCVRGHPLVAANVYWHPGKYGRPWRECKACKALRGLASQSSGASDE